MIIRSGSKSLTFDIYDYQYEVEKITKNKNNIMLSDTKRLLFIAKDMKKLEKILRKAEKESKCH